MLGDEKEVSSNEQTGDEQDDRARDKQELIDRQKNVVADHDITEEFIRAAKGLSDVYPRHDPVNIILELDLGEIVIHGSYSLSEAVSAIELMDPKMDCGIEKPDLTLGLENALKVRNPTLLLFSYCLERKDKTKAVSH